MLLKHFFITTFFLILLAIKGTIVNARDRACNLLVAIDTGTVFQNNNIPKSEDIVRTVNQYVESVNDIYKETILKNPPNQNIYLRLQDIWLINNFVPGCNNESIVLHQFSRSFDTSEYCLAHLLTYRDFGCVVGLATVRGLCRKSDNTGFTKSNLLPDTKDLTISTMAHEIGHNFGAEHDGGKSTAYSSCKNKTLIMGTAEVLQFSYCSLQAMQHRLHAIIADKELYDSCLKVIDQGANRKITVENKDLEGVGKVDCPVSRSEEEDCKDKIDPPEPPEPPPDPVCGNGKVEHPEQCDCGMTHEECTDPCCYPGVLSENDLALNASAKACSIFTHHPCTVRYWSPLVYGLGYSWIFLFIVALIVGTILVLDWRGRRKLYGHIIFHEDDIRINTNSEQQRRYH